MYIEGEIRLVWVGWFCDTYYTVIHKLCTSILFCVNMCSVTFCAAAVLKDKDQKTLIKPWWSYEGRINVYIWTLGETWVDCHSQIFDWKRFTRHRSLKTKSTNKQVYLCKRVNQRLASHLSRAIDNNYKNLPKIKCCADISVLTDVLL